MILLCPKQTVWNGRKSPICRILVKVKLFIFSLNVWILVKNIGNSLKVVAQSTVARNRSTITNKGKMDNQWQTYYFVLQQIDL